MTKSIFWDFLKKSSSKIAQYTGYVHLGVYLSIWIAITLLLYLISGCKTFSIYLTFVLGSLINLCLGILFWFLPGLLVRYKCWRGKDWSGLLTILNIGIIRYVLFPCWSLIFLCVLFSTVFKTIAWSDTLPSAKSKVNLSSRVIFHNPTVSLSQKIKIKTPEKQAEEKVLFEERKVAAGRGDAEAQTDIALMYKRGKGVEKNYEEKVKWYRLAAEKGYARAQRNLAISYDIGEGVPQDYKEALKWYKLAAEQSDISAQYNLGLMHEKEQGVPKNYGEAFKWYTLAAEQGDKDAQISLGVMYEFGKGVPQDDKEAFKWYQLASNRGDSLAQFRIGSFYDEGLVVSKDYREAAKWYRLSAEQGCPLAQHNLGFLYSVGDGVEKNPQEAFKWMHLAANQGLKIAQRNLGYTYWKGEGVPKDLKESLKWYKLAAEQGNKDAEKMLKKLKKKASCEEIAEAMRSADEWKKSHDQ